MTKPLVILDPYWRSMDELFSKDSLDHLHKNFDVVWGVDQKFQTMFIPMPCQMRLQLLPQTPFLPRMIFM